MSLSNCGDVIGFLFGNRIELVRNYSQEQSDEWSQPTLDQHKVDDAKNVAAVNIKGFVVCPELSPWAKCDTKYKCSGDGYRAIG